LCSAYTNVDRCLEECQRTSEYGARIRQTYAGLRFICVDHREASQPTMNYRQDGIVGHMNEKDDLECSPSAFSVNRFEGTACGIRSVLVFVHSSFALMIATSSLRKAFR
ncbi:hypothetical protein Tcan_00282, partial [Toxocara canis]